MPIPCRAQSLLDLRCLASPCRPSSIMNTQRYEIYPEIEEIFTERKEAFIEEIAQHYGQDIPFLYEHCPDV